jgi:hypothetical protein
VHPMGGTEIHALRRLKREQPEARHVFLTERLAPMSPAGFRKLIRQQGNRRSAWASNFRYCTRLRHTMAASNRSFSTS